jgi:transposase
MLTARGIKPIAASLQDFESTWLFGAFSPINSKKLLVEFPFCNSDTFQIFIDILSKTDAEELMLLLLDNASFHKAKKLVIPDNIVLINIPPYSSELNPAEQIWAWFKRAFTNKTFTTIEQVRQFLDEQTKLLSDSIVKSTCFREWILA